MELSNYAKIFKALSNEQRLNIFMMIYRNCCGMEGKIPLDKTSCCGVKGLSRSTISHHFKELQSAGLITCEREGQTFRCTVNKNTVAEIKKFLK
jgi:ArsR family transcriptional regulator